MLLSRAYIWQIYKNFPVLVSRVNGLGGTHSVACLSRCESNRGYDIMNQCWLEYNRKNSRKSKVIVSVLPLVPFLLWSIQIFFSSIRWEFNQLIINYKCPIVFIFRAPLGFVLRYATEMPCGPKKSQRHFFAVLHKYFISNNWKFQQSMVLFLQKW